MTKDISLHDPAQFDKRFLDYTQKTDTYEEAYALTEQDYIKVFGCHKYSNYNSYRVSRYKRIKKKTPVK